MTRFLSALLVLFVAAGCQQQEAGHEPGNMAHSEGHMADAGLLKPDSKVVFLGDSITEAGVRPGGYVALIGEKLNEHHPEWEVEIIGAGISGHKVPDLLERLDRDVLIHEPDIVVIYIGINDVWHWFKFDPLGTEENVYEEGLNTLITRIEEAGSSVMLCTPSVIGEKTDGSNESDEMLAAYAEISRQVADQRDVKLCDLNTAFMDHLKEHNPDNAESGILTSDGVHLNEAGNKFVADFILSNLMH